MQTTAAYKNSFQVLKKGFSHKNAQIVLNANENKLAYTLGNSKIGEDTLIFNMGSAHTCPSAKLGLCDMAHKSLGGNGKCYALKAEYFYPQSLPFRTLQKVQWDNWTAGEIADQIFAVIFRSRKFKTPVRFVRFNEAGDFYTFSCVMKAGKIAGYVAELCKRAGLPVVKFYTYTHRSDLFKGIGGAALLSSAPANFTINGSNFKAHNEFRVMEITRAERDAKDENGKKVNKYTCMDDCSICSLCKVHGKEGITVIQSRH